MMNSTEDAIQKFKMLAIIFIIYSVALPMMSYVIQSPVTQELTLLSWMFILIMPMEFIMLYPIYLFIRKNFNQKSPIGPALLMYTPSVTPAVYALMASLISPSMRILAVGLGITSSFMGILLAFILLSRLIEEDLPQDLDTQV